MSLPRYWLIGGGAVVAVLLAAGVIAALLGGERVLQEGTPERAVQDHLKAVFDKDYAAVQASLSGDLDDCRVEDLVRQGFRIGGTVSDRRFTLEETQLVNGAAIVTVRVASFSSDGPFGSYESSYTQTYSLREEGAEWKFTRYPWPYSGCGVRPPEPTVPAPSSTRTPAPTPGPE